MVKYLKYVMYTIIVVLVVSFFIVVGYLSNWYQDDVKTFYVTYDGNMLQSSSVIELSSEDEHVFGIVDLLNNDSEYKVSIYANTGSSLIYIMNNKYYAWADEGDVSDLFDIEYADNSFNIYTGLSNMSDMLNELHPDDDIVLDDEVDNDTNLFTMFINDEINDNVIEVNFNVVSLIDSIELDSDIVIL